MPGELQHEVDQRPVCRGGDRQRPALGERADRLDGVGQQRDTPLR